MQLVRGLWSSNALRTVHVQRETGVRILSLHLLSVGVKKEVFDFVFAMGQRRDLAACGGRAEQSGTEEHCSSQWDCAHWPAP